MEDYMVMAISLPNLFLSSLYPKLEKVSMFFCTGTLLPDKKGRP